MHRRRRSEETPVYELRVTLQHIEPPIWRRIRLRGDVTLARLHRILQHVMGWKDYHLYCFTVGGASYGPPDPDGMLEMKPAGRARLREVAPVEAAHLSYEYDFGDGWEHEIVVERILPPDASLRSAVCLEGERACPPEDCGGTSGYEEVLEAMRDPEHPEHDAMLAWLGRPFDPEAFDPVPVNRALERMRYSPP